MALCPMVPAKNRWWCCKMNWRFKGAESDALPRVIWVPDGTTSAHPEQQRFIEALHKDPEAQFGADLITGDLKGCKAAIHAALKKLGKPVPGDPERSPATRGQIYLPLCEERDLKDTRPIRKFAGSKASTVARPPFEGDAATVREANQDLLPHATLYCSFTGPEINPGITPGQ